MLAQWPRSPATILGLSSSGASEAELLDFNRSVMRFWRWYESMSNAQVQVPECSLPKLRKGYVWAPKYAHDESILARYYGSRSPGEAIDPIVAAMSRDDFDQLMDDWDPNDIPA